MSNMRSFTRRLDPECRPISLKKRREATRLLRQRGKSSMVNRAMQHALSKAKSKGEV